MSRHLNTDTTGRRVNLIPSRDDLVDAGFVLVLMLLALLGFRTTFSGVGYLLAGIAGVVLGLLIAHLANALKQPMIAIAAMTLAVFFLLGGAIVLRSTAIAGLLPSGETFRGLADQSVHGWKDLLTTLPPVDGTGPLLVLPYILGLLGGVGGFCLARRVRPALAPVVAPLAVLIAVIMLGTQSPAAQLLQGGVFGVVALAWTAMRSMRLRPPLQSGTGRTARLVTIGVLLAVSAGGAALIAPHVPGQDNKRLVLRNYVDPPFNVGQYSSPLAGFRKYTKPARTLFSTPLFTVSGLPRKIPIRIATLDAYDGVTWTAAGQAVGAGGLPDTYQRVGREIDNPARGATSSYRVTIDNGYENLSVRMADSYWLPAAGALTEIDFHGKHADSHSDYFRYNLATATGIVPDTLSAGDSYSATSVLPRVATLRSTDALATGGGPAAAEGSFLKTKASEWAGNGTDPTAQVIAIGERLHRIGHYTDGEEGKGTFLPGHYRERLLNFINDPQVAGDDEQFAATYALMITQLGVPARVVFGAEPESGGVVRGRDIRGWVEVQLADLTWRAIAPDTFINRKQKAQKQQPEQQTEQQGKIVPPPARGKPRSGLDDATDAAARSRTAQRKSDVAQESSGLPGWVLTTAKWVGTPLLIIGILCALIVLAKFQRRRLRRTRGTPASRLSRGWREVVDHARDLGARPVLAGTTRKEQAMALTSHDLGLLARSADSHVFGPADPDHDAAARFWSEVDAARRRMSGAVGRRRRIKAALSLGTFLPTRAKGGPA